ncbi:glycerophosphodiester phosphodiesterase [Paenibacillus lemnae]|uniref:glycerophosphodiester phosphodiesterase n=1 Tax=Paenibacillus lemnae TaxID=1330551 RepID=UPI0031B5E9EF
MSNKKVPIIFAHRGASGEAPENTLAAFSLGLEQGCDGFELDVHLSKDGEIVVIHDDTIDRTTNGSGKVRDMTVEQLQAVDAGAWFDEKYKGEVIPRLEEVFDLAPPEIVINVEIKGSCEGKLEPILVELLKRKGRLDTVVVSSFDWKSLKHLKQLEPAIKVGLLYNLNLDHHEHLPAAAGTEVYSLHPNMKRWEPKDITGPQAAGLQVYGWTINQAETMTEAIEMGMDGIITDYPGRLKALLKGTPASR